MKSMLKTQAFADLCDTTKKTIIYYDRLGLLKPAARENDFRLYRPKQVLTFQKIVLLKSFGLSLKEIQKYLHRDQVLEKLFLQQRSQLKKQKQALEKRIAKIEEFSANLKRGKPMIVPKVKKVKPYAIYGIEKVGRYVDIDRHQREVFALIGDAGFQRVGTTIFHEPYYSPEQAQMVSGAVIKAKKPKEIKGVKIIKVPAYKAVAYTHVGPYSYMSYVWQFLTKYIKENRLKHHPKLDCREFYIIGGAIEENKDNLVTELQIPIL